MLRLRLGCRALSQLLPPPSSSPISQLLGYHSRLLSAAAPVVSPNPSFAVEDYLVSTCGLTRAQALKASPKLAHLRSPANPDAVLAFLAGLGLSGADVAAVVARDPKFLCTGVDKGLSPIVRGLSGLGLSHSEIARLLLQSPNNFRSRSIVPKLQYYLRLFGSSERLLRATNFNTALLAYKSKVELNVAFLRQCGFGDRDMAKLCSSIPRMVTTDLECVQRMVALTESLGVPRGSGMFRHALSAVAFRDKKQIAAKVDHLKKTLGWSDAEDCWLQHQRKVGHKL